MTSDELRCPRGHRAASGEEAAPGLAGDDPAAGRGARARDRDQGAASCRRSTSRRSRWSPGWSRTTGSWSRRSPTGSAARPSAATSWSSRTRVAGSAAPRPPARPTPSTKLLAKIGLYPSGGHLVKRVIGVAGDTSTAATSRAGSRSTASPLDEKDYARRGRRRLLRPDDRLQLDGRTGARGHDLRDGRQPLPLGRLDRAHVPRARPTACRATSSCRSTSWSARSSSLLWPRCHFRWLQRPDTFADVPDAS